jgi:two-component sensor histidine kinase
MSPLGSLAFSLRGGIDACTAARREIIAADGAVPASLREDVLLLVSELVTNAVRHAGVGADQALGVELERSGRGVRVEVAHPGNGFHYKPEAPSLDATSGWGLVLVDRIANLWGITRSTIGTSVWFELWSEA